MNIKVFKQNSVKCALHYTTLKSIWLLNTSYRPEVSEVNVLVTSMNRTKHGDTWKP